MDKNPESLPDEVPQPENDELLANIAMMYVDAIPAPRHITERSYPARLVDNLLNFADIRSIKRDDAAKMAIKGLKEAGANVGFKRRRKIRKIINMELDK